MRVLVVGSGGREHALVWKLRQSGSVKEIFCAPGNPGIAEIADCVPIDSSSIVELADFALNVNIQLTVVGPELPLDLGIVDEFTKRNLMIFGPSQVAAELESSKVFAKEFMRQRGIPTAEFQIVTGYEEALKVLRSGKFKMPVVLKADGLAGGKGVTVCQDEKEAQHTLEVMIKDRKFGTAGDRIVIEEFLQGHEVSFQVISDGKRVLPLATSQDHKLLLDNDRGPNTGGMGAYSPAMFLNKETHMQIMNEIILPTISGMAEDNRMFRGVLYAGLMLTDERARVLEFNARFGDPETQALLPRMDCDFAELLHAAAQGRLDEDAHVEWRKEAAVCVVVASAGYPMESSFPQQEIHGLEEAAAMENVYVFHAGTSKQDEKIYASGGRVLGVTATDPHFPAAYDRVYEALSKIKFDGMHYRTDIGKRALEHTKRN